MKLLLITLSNIGDVVLTTPVVSALKARFPEVKLDVMVGEAGRDIFEGDPAINNILTYPAGSGLIQRIKFGLWLKTQGYGLVINLRHGIKTAPKEIAHMRDRHLWKLQQKVSGISTEKALPHIWIDKSSYENATSLLLQNSIREEDLVIAIAAGAKSHTKRWRMEGFTQVCHRLSEEFSVKVVLVGDNEDKKISDLIMQQEGPKPIDLTGKTTIKELAAVLSRSALLISNDSASMHIAWAVGVPVVALFGPTDANKYGPLGPKDIVIRKALDCAPCEAALCKIDVHDMECMKQITADEVLNAAKVALQ